MGSRAFAATSVLRIVACGSHRVTPAMARVMVAGPSRTPTLLTRRSTAFWTTSYPGTTEAEKQGPLWKGAKEVQVTIDSGAAPPNLPGPSPVVEEKAEDSGRYQRKQRYLDRGELSLRCSVLDSKGNWTAEEGSYRKSDLCRVHDLDPRDLRKLDSLTPSLVPIIVTRRSCILISILHIRALIKSDCVIIFNAPGTEESDAAKRFKAHLQANVRAGIAVRESQETECRAEHRPVCEDELGLSYEHRALESILVDTANALEEEMGFIRILVSGLLEKLEHDIDRENLRKLLHYSRRLAGFQSRAKYIKSTVDELLDSDEDLSAMYITDKVHGHPRGLEDHEQLELLFESFAKQVEEIVSEIDTTAANMSSTQEVAELMLDSGRNALLALDIKVSIAAVSMGAGAFIAGIFGMNLTSSIEETPYAFVVVAGGAAVAAMVLFLYGARVLRKVRHISLRYLRELAKSDRVDYAALLNPHTTATAQSITGESIAKADPIPDYETRWQLVRGRLVRKTPLWDRIFRPHSMRRTLLGMRSKASLVWEGRRSKPLTTHRAPSTTSNLAHPSSRPTAPRSDHPHLSREINK